MMSRYLKIVCELFRFMTVFWYLLDANILTTLHCCLERAGMRDRVMFRDARPARHSPAIPGGTKTSNLPCARSATQ